MRTVFVQHITDYNYSNPVSFHSNQIMLYPTADEFQTVNSHYLNISGNPNVTIHKDFFGNSVGTFNIVEPHTYLKIISTIQITKKNKPRPIISDSIELQWDSITKLKNDIYFFEYFNQTDTLHTIKSSEIISGNYKALPPLDLCVILSGYVYRNFKYKKGITTVKTALKDIWNLKAGVCQDFTNVLLHLNRLFGIPSRYVSGYICPNEASDFRGVGATHAWVEVFTPSSGWIGLDPTNNCFTDENYIKLTVGRKFEDCSPVKGVYSGDCSDILSVSVKVNDKNKFDSNQKQIFPESGLEKKALNSYAQQQQDLLTQQQQQQQQQ